MTNSYEECRALYRSARNEERSSPADRQAVRLALAATVATGVHVAATGVGAKSLLQGILSSHFLGGLLVGAVAGTVVSAAAFVVFPTGQPRAVGTTPGKPAPAAHARSVGERNESTRQLPRLLEPTAVADQASRGLSVPAAPGSTIPRTLSAAPHPAAVTAPPAPLPLPTDQLLDETQALARVQEALSRKDPDFAWTLLQEQDRQFPQGQLAEERAAAKVLTLCAAGRIPEANQARARFIATHPNSPLSNRVLKGCEP